MKAEGFEAHLVGGGVRDLLLGREPKDFDVATSAHPEDVRRIFRNCRLIGRRFRLAHVFFGPDIIEVATFRGHHQGGETDAGDHSERNEDGMILRDNVYGTLEEDAWRRDFTINALYYNIRDFSVVDYTGGLEDLRAGLIRMIGDPEIRFREDPVRMLRAVRFAAKLGFRIEESTETVFWSLGETLSQVPAARLFDEILKLFLSGYAVQVYELLRHYRLFGTLFPYTESALEIEEQGFPLVMLVQGLANTDARIAEAKPVTPAFLFAILLWEPVRLRMQQLVAEGQSELQAIQQAGDEIVSRQNLVISVPKRFSLQTREIWNLQVRLKSRGGKRALRLFSHPRFRAAYDFLLLRAHAGEEDKELADWWTEFQTQDHHGQNGMVDKVADTRSSAPRRRRRRPRRRPAGDRT